jgi:predicted RNase H-like HicB family nuclease
MLLKMELALRIQIEKLPEGLCLATSDELPVLVPQGRTIAEARDIARDVARKLIEARREREGNITFPSASQRRDYTIVVAAQVGRACGFPISGYRAEPESFRIPVRPAGGRQPRNLVQPGNETRNHCAESSRRHA